jgi:hypothetical protein
MADDIDVTPSIEEEETNRVEKRIKDLSGKVRTTSEERDAAKALADKEALEKVTALKDVEFYKNFNTTASKYPGANEFQDKIKEKVALGLDLDEATMLVMTKEGKYAPPAAPPAPKASPAGGSAPTNLTTGGEKTIGEMTQAEKRAQLFEAEKRGDIGLT